MDPLRNVGRLRFYDRVPAPLQRMLTRVNRTTAKHVSRLPLIQLTSVAQKQGSMQNICGRFPRRAAGDRAMNIPTSITFHGMDASDALRSRIEARVQRLGRFATDILSCDVVVSASEHRHHRGNRYAVRASVAMRGCEIEAGRTPSPDAGHDDPYVAMAHTFDALRRRIEDHVRRRCGDIKHHADS
jgi:ribosomal subunit interface protein